MTENENYSEEVLLQIYSDIVGTDFDTLYLASNARICGARTYCGAGNKYANTCNTRCQCMC